MKIANIECILIAVKAYLKLGSTSEKWILPRASSVMSCVVKHRSH